MRSNTQVRRERALTMSDLAQTCLFGKYFPIECRNIMQCSNATLYDLFQVNLPCKANYYCTFKAVLSTVKAVWKCWKCATATTAILCVKTLSTVCADKQNKSGSLKRVFTVLCVPTTISFTCTENSAPFPLQIYSPFALNGGYSLSDTFRVVDQVQTEHWTCCSLRTYRCVYCRMCYNNIDWFSITCHNSALYKIWSCLWVLATDCMQPSYTATTFLQCGWVSRVLMIRMHWFKAD